MIIRKKNIEVSVGKAVGHILEDILVSAKKRLWIVSPWLSPKYAEFLVKKSKEGVDIKLITTNDYENEQHKESLKILIEKREENVIKNARVLLGVSIIFLIIGLSGLIGTPYGILFIAGGMVLLFLSFWKKRVFIPKIPLTVIDKFADFTHSKIYLIDDKIGAVGSANFTDSGFWRNVETIVLIKGEKLVKKLEEVYKILEGHPLKKIIPIEEVGINVYKKVK